MAKYLLIESRDPFDSNDTRFCGDLARQLAAAKNDSFSLKERGIDESRLASGVAAAPLDVVLDALAEGAKVIWH